MEHEYKLIKVLRKYKRALGWTIADIKEINPAICMHRILMEENYKPIVQPQRRLNPAMQEVVKKEVVKRLVAGIIYLISDSPWVSPVHVVPKKGDDCRNAFEFLKEQLTNTPIVVFPDWSQPFEIMCDASDTTVGAILGQKKNKIFRPIYYADRTLNEAQMNYATTEKELLAVVFAFDKFRSYLIRTKVTVFTDHAALKRCVPETDMNNILSHCHDGIVGGHYGGRRTTVKVLEAGFFWPTLFRYARNYVATCDKCQRSGNISKRDEMPLNSILVCEIFDVWGIDFMGHFPPSNGCEYILVIVDYISK
ncbi:uncharacterized protein LOC142168947 [Nicotiana tabacum]|uniref:Uncharacterized protein LOC142168947 n=1 Tax=Nicotiana tabacum TaxID=4097 RepID=A0AC58SMP4_TOBAC